MRRVEHLDPAEKSPGFQLREDALAGCSEAGVVAIELLVVGVGCSRWCYGVRKVAPAPW